VFDRWLVAALERYLADLTQREVTRALRALSSCYVERRSKLASGEAMATAGKRAAFALFYGPLHFLTIAEIALAVAGPSAARPPRERKVIDLGCGTGAAGAAWAIQTGGDVEGYDVNAWAVSEAGWTFARLGVRGPARRVPIDRVRFPTAPSDVLAAYVLNEVAPDVRDRMRKFQ
jgi:methylase of polypeptide subunit release factors